MNKINHVSQINEALSRRKRMIEIADEIITGMTRKELVELLKDLEKFDNARDFYRDIYIEDDYEPTKEEIFLFNEIKEEVKGLRDIGVYMNIFDMMSALDEENEGDKFLDYKNSKNYDDAIKYSLLKMARFDRDINNIGEVDDAQENELVEKNTTDEDMEILKDKLREKGEKEELIEKKIKRFKYIKNRQKEYNNNLQIISPNLRKDQLGINDYKKLQIQVDDLIDNNYFDWMGHHLWKLHNLRKSLKETKKLVITPTIKKYLEEIKYSEKMTGKPPFVTGDLGSGKTEMSLHIGRECNRENIELIKQNYEKLFGSCDVNDEMIIEPVVLSGHKDFDPGDLIGGFEIKSNSLDMNKLIDVYKKGLLELKNRKGEIDEDKEELFKRTLLQGEAYKSIETKAYLGKLFQAMALGKTIIIDEVNAIPHEILIIMNHYVTRKPGDIIYPPINNLEPIIVQKGFKVIFTGNVPKEGQVGYIGRTDMDAAWLSRLNIIAVDYLPNSRKNEAILSEVKKTIKYGDDFDEKKQEYLASLSNKQKAIIRRGGELEIADGAVVKVSGKENDELFQTLSVFGLPRSYVGKLPKDYFEKIFNLARISRIIQDAYSQKNIDSSYYQNSGVGDPRKFLKNAVPSMRSLLTIIQAWQNDGYSRDIDYYLFKYFIQQYKGKEQQWVYDLYKSFGGFFQDEDVFPYDPKKISNINFIGHIFKDSNVKKNTANLKTFSQQEILESLFGPAPKLSDEEILLVNDLKLDKDLEKEKKQMLDEIDAQIFIMNDFLREYKNNIMNEYCEDSCSS